MSDTQKPNQGNREGGNRRPRNNNNNNNRNRNNRNRNNRPRPNRAPRPLQLTFWQKVLKAIGLFNEEKARKQQQSKRTPHEKKTTTAPKSNVRNVKTDDDSTAPRNKPRRRAPQPVAVESARLYVGNLSYDATEHDIEELFKGVGSVKKVEIIYNRNTHKSKGYGFIQMLNKEEAERAVEVLHDQPFLGRQLVVNGSKSRKDGDSTADKATDSTEFSASE